MRTKSEKKLVFCFFSCDKNCLLLLLLLLSSLLFLPCFNFVQIDWPTARPELFKIGSIVSDRFFFFFFFFKNREKDFFVFLYRLQTKANQLDLFFFLLTFMFIRTRLILPPLYQIAITFLLSFLLSFRLPFLLFACWLLKQLRRKPLDFVRFVRSNYPFMSFVFCACNYHHHHHRQHVTTT